MKAGLSGELFSNKLFFNPAPAWNYTQDSGYTDRYYMEQLKVGKAFYPTPPPTPGDWQGNYEWVFIDQFGLNATIYKKSLGAYVNPASGTYYAWYGNRTAANTYYNGRSDWMDPTYDNATYVVNLTEVWQ